MSEGMKSAMTAAVLAGCPKPNPLLHVTAYKHQD